MEAYTYRMGARTTTDDPNRYRLSDDVERWNEEPIARLKVYLRRNGLVDDDFIGGSGRPTTWVTTSVRVARRWARPAAVYAEETEELRAQREGFAAYNLRGGTSMKSPPALRWRSTIPRGPRNEQRAEDHSRKGRMGLRQAKGTIRRS